MRIDLFATSGEFGGIRYYKIIKHAKTNFL